MYGAHGPALRSQRFAALLLSYFCAQRCKGTTASSYRPSTRWLASVLQAASLVVRQRDNLRAIDQVLDAYEDDDEKNVALVDALLGRTPSPTKRKAPAAAEPDTQYLDSPGFLPPQEKRRKPSPKDAVVDLTAED